MTSRFPHFSETFIVREMDAVAAAGHPVTLYPLLRQRQPIVHPAARRWVAVARWTDRLLPVLRSHLLTLRRQPGAYVGTSGRVLRAHASSPTALAKALLVWAEAVHIAQLVRRDGVEHVHAHYATHPALTAWVVHQLTGTPYSVTVHAHDIFCSSPMLGQKLSAAACVITISDFNRARVRELIDGRPVRIAVVHCGVEPARYRRSSPPAAPPWQLLSIGSLQEYKGHRHLVTACRLLRERGVDVRLTVVGEGRLRPALETQIRNEGLHGIVQLVGVQDEDAVATLIGQSHCYVQPSVVAANGQMEGIPVALMEAMAAGLPVVATRLSGIPELVRPGGTGWLVPPADPEALAAAVEQVLTRSDLVARVVAAARELVVAEFEVSRAAAQLSEVFRRAVGAVDEPAIPTGRQAVAS